jgi:tetratricopeptide (TPR) repeat protein
MPRAPKRPRPSKRGLKPATPTGSAVHSATDSESAFGSLLLRGQVGDVLEYAGVLAAEAPDPERRAAVLLRLGILCERANRFEAAAKVYETGLTFEPKDWGTSYFLKNNLGYSLNQLGRFAEGEACCRAAIHRDPLRHNAWKNLGVALEGQRHFGEAAEAFVHAIRICPQDPRALAHLGQMAKREHEAVAAAIPDFDAAFERFAEIVEYAQAGRLEELVKRPLVQDEPKAELN